ncbi:MAG: acyl-CoA dehydrogenase, partial [Nonomuraea sp.]|nr:acyl-CoA dehydrogenase [Nonomuraea sp.]
MGIGLTEEHQALAASVRGLAGRTVEHRALAAQGLLGLHLPEEHGGQGFGLVELCVALEALGEQRAPGPYLPTALTSATLTRSALGGPALGGSVFGGSAFSGSALGGSALGGSAFGGKDLLGGLADGTLTAAVVLGDGGLALGAAGADLFLVPVADGGWALLDRSNVTAEPAEGIDLDRALCTVTAV